MKYFTMSRKSQQLCLVIELAKINLCGQKKYSHLPNTLEIKPKYQLEGFT